MDVHRGRFVAYPTHAITAAAFTRTNDYDLIPNQPTPALRLALGRKNGDVEIWNPQGGQWIQESIFPGEEEDRSIDGLLWTQEPNEEGEGEEQGTMGRYRLFSIASSPSVIEWDLATGTSATKSSGNFSQVWCFAAQPMRNRKGKGKTGDGEGVKSSDIVAGCVNGTLVLLSTEDGQLQFKKTIVAASGKETGCMSIAYQNRDRVVAGFADGIIRVLDVRRSQTIRSMGLGRGLPGAPKVPYVWQVKCLPSGDIVSGDSDGGVKFWDGKSYTMTQNVNGHDTDCLGLVTSADGKTIFSSSIDGRIAMFKHATDVSGRPSWVKTSHHRIHDGEVKAIAAFDGKKMGVVVTGGVDVAPIVNPIREFGRERQQILPGLPQEPPIASARHGRLLASWWGKTINIWRIYKQNEDANPEPQATRRLVASLELDIEDKIRHVSLSEDGRALAVTTSSEVKVFQLRRRTDTHALGSRKLSVPDRIQLLGARLTTFSPDGKWLVVITLDNEVHVLRISSTVDNPKLLRVVGVVELERGVTQQDQHSGLGDYLHSITRIAFASDSSVLVTADLSGNIDTWVLDGEEDKSKPAIDILEKIDDDDSDNASDSSSDSSDDDDDDDEIVFYGQRWKESSAGQRLPKLDSAPIVVLFRPQAYASLADKDKTTKPQYRLWVMTARHQMYEFDVLAGRLSDWSRRNPTSSLPKNFHDRKYRVMGGVWDVGERSEHIWLHGANWLLRLDVGDDVNYQAQSSKKRKGDSQVVSRTKRPKVGRITGGKHEDLYLGIPESIKRHDGQGGEVDVRLDERSHLARNDDNDEDQDDMSVDIEPVDQPRITDGNDDDEQNGEPRRRKLAVPILKYKPILGIATLGNVVRTRGDGDVPEMVIIERPPLDVRES